MAYTPESYKLACDLVIPHILKTLDTLSPGSAANIIESAVLETSSNVELLDDETKKEAMYLIAGWENHGVASLTDLHGTLLACEMQLACFIDQMERHFPGTSKALNEGAVKKLEELMKTSNFPYVQNAIERMKDHCRLVAGFTAKPPSS